MENNLKDDFQIDFVGIGAMKAATSWIYECLQEHPELHLAPKDQEQIAFFFKEDPSQKELEDYKYFFKNSNEEQLKGDYHVGYLTNPQVISRMKERNPEIKVIVCLRNPIERAFSEYRFLKFAKDADWESFEEAIRKQPSILENGLYYEHLKKYFDQFPRENILVLLFDEIRKDPSSFIQKIYAFLEVNDGFVPPSINTKINLTNFKLTWVGRVIHKGIIAPLLYYTKWAWKLKRSVLLKKLLGWFSKFYSSSKKEKSQEAERYLTEYYQEDISNLENLINKELSHWK
ncbi:hypothetical protein AKJ56_01675 [candidate division MSBL1 archaeon SCGC-AAA382N08]|uniref:Sulfotransferase domain-containing protein n=1 Tax=candidate division MSBL1 archaeon SCGC-AAA382N08 TaxID=1698285 RepID=A0A133VP30_9EURY|nr:hypothetical protein AKJ56_01675 [candidate division MSBL1 archaeon SCGC-AAA382N08]